MLRLECCVQFLRLCQLAAEGVDGFGGCGGEVRGREFETLRTTRILNQHLLLLIPLMRARGM